MCDSKSILSNIFPLIYAFVPLVIASVPFETLFTSLNPLNLSTSLPDWNPNCLNNSNSALILIIDTVKYYNYVYAFIFARFHSLYSRKFVPRRQGENKKMAGLSLKHIYKKYPGVLSASEEKYEIEKKENGVGNVIMNAFDIFN